MTNASDPVLESLRAATQAPSWAQRTYTTERTHTQVLVAALNSKGPAAKALAAALWNETSSDKLQPEQITRVVANPEHRLKHGEHSVIDLLVELDLGSEKRQIAIEVKVDGVPYTRQLASMGGALGLGPHRRLVLLSLGAAQASRIEPDGTELPEVHRWYVANMLGLANELLAASPVPGDTQAWLDELQREEHRREKSWEAPDLADCGYRSRLQTAYRYKQLAARLAPASHWEVSLQPFGVVLHAKSSHYEIPGTTVTLYLELMDDTLRIKAGAWYDDSNARAAAAPLLPRIAAAMTKAGFTVALSKKQSGSSVTLLSLGPEKKPWTLTDFVDQLARAHAAWNATDWSKQPAP